MHQCHRGAFCADAARDPDSGRRIPAAIPTETGLCDTCQRQAQRGLAELPRDYFHLHRELGGSTTCAAEPVAKTPERPIPIRADVDALMTDIAHELACWAESVAEVLGIRLDTQQMAAMRPGKAVQRCVDLLRGSFPALLALRAVEHVGWVYGCPTILTRDGTDAALVFLGLHHRTRTLLGLTRLKHHLHVPCPRCETTALTRDDGSETIDCTRCGRRYTWDEYSRLCGILADRRTPAA